MGKRNRELWRKLFPAKNSFDNYESSIFYWHDAFKCRQIKTAFWKREGNFLPLRTLLNEKAKKITLKEKNSTPLQPAFFKHSPAKMLRH